MLEPQVKGCTDHKLLHPRRLRRKRVAQLEAPGISVAVTQLVKDFYHDLPYVELRIRSLRLIANLPKEECNWKRLMARISHPDTDPEQREMLVAVNRTAAFYLVVRGLIGKARGQQNHASKPFRIQLYGLLELRPNEDLRRIQRC